MRQCQFCQSNREAKEIVAEKLRGFYFLSFNFYMSKPIDELITDSASKEAILHRDWQQYDEGSEWLKRFYEKKEIRFRIKQAASETRNRFHFPHHFHEKANEVLEVRVEYIRAQQRLMIFDQRNSSKSRIAALMEAMQPKPNPRPIPTFTWTLHDIYNPSISSHKKTLMKTLKRNKKKTVARKKTPMERKVVKQSLLSSKISPIPSLQCHVLKLPKTKLGIKDPSLRKKSQSTQRPRKPLVMTSRIASSHVSPARPLPPPSKPKKPNADYYSSTQVIYTSKAPRQREKTSSELQHEEVKGLLRLRSVREHLSSALKTRNSEVSHSRTKPSTLCSGKRELISKH